MDVQPGTAIRAYWDTDAASYDSTRAHGAPVVERAAWAAVLRRLLPPPPAAVLDVGAGTGFLALILAELGYRVTAADLAPAMLERLRGKAGDAGLIVETVESPADAPPPGPFDAVVERHLTWTLPDPAGALAAWRRVAPGGRLVLFESMWGDAADPLERLRGRGRRVLRGLRREPPEHHAEYPPELRAELPLGSGTTPQRVAELVVTSGWAGVRLERLRDVEWAALVDRPLADRLLGLAPRFAVSADDFGRAKADPGRG